MTDIVKRLRAAEFRHMPYLCNEAADRIDELTKSLTLAQTCLNEATNSDQYHLIATTVEFVRYRRQG